MSGSLFTKEEDLVYTCACPFTMNVMIAVMVVHIAYRAREEQLSYRAAPFVLNLHRSRLGLVNVLLRSINSDSGTLLLKLSLATLQVEGRCRDAARVALLLRRNRTK